MKNFHKSMTAFCLTLCFLLSASAQSLQLLSEYNSQLPIWGVSWTLGQDAISFYYPSFYTGFAPRSEYADRIHIRTSRGNQTRVSVILDEKTVQDYLFDLVTRSEFYKTMTMAPEGQKPILNANPKGANVVPHAQYFMDIVNSSEYGISNWVAQTDASGSQSPEFYVASLNILKALNPGRVYSIRLNLTQEFQKWKNALPEMLNGKTPSEAFTKNSNETIIALNSLVWGRVNYTAEPSNEVIADLVNLASVAMNGSDSEFIPQAMIFFTKITGDKYNLKTVGADGQWVDALSCDSQCWLTYPEFTTIYPTGSIQAFVSDKFKNRIPTFASQGLWNFIDRSYHEVDHIRKDAYYGWAPKMDFEGIGNGFHNPAVKFSESTGFTTKVKELLGTDLKHNLLWSVKRGGVSSGCLRLPLGHVWEMRHIMPVENEKMKAVFFFGDAPQAFDLYDIDGNGELEIMGVEYMISYNTAGSSGLAKRDGKDLNIGMDAKETFYKDLYGANNVFEVVDGQFTFMNPSASLPSFKDYQAKSVKTSVNFSGDYPLYEQTYERDKVQFYVPASKEGLSSAGNSTFGMRMIRLMGRVKGCSPAADPVECGATAFQTERDDLLKRFK